MFARLPTTRGASPHHGVPSHIRRTRRPLSRTVENSSGGVVSPITRPPVPDIWPAFSAWGTQNGTYRRALSAGSLPCRARWSPPRSAVRLYACYHATPCAQWPTLDWPRFHQRSAACTSPMHRSRGPRSVKDAWLETPSRWSRQARTLPGITPKATRSSRILRNNTAKTYGF